MAKLAGKTRSCGRQVRAANTTSQVRVVNITPQMREAKAGVIERPSEPFGLRVGHAESAGGVVLRKSPRPSGCSRFVRREIADAMPAICSMLLSRTMDGDLAALKLLLQMAVASQEPGGRSPGRAGAVRSAGFARKILVGFKDWEARETAKRRES